MTVTIKTVYNMFSIIKASVSIGEREPTFLFATMRLVQVTSTVIHYVWHQALSGTLSRALSGYY